jgi:hypothetical protein
VDSFQNAISTNLKRQISQISFSHEVDPPELDEEFWKEDENFDERMYKLMDESNLGIAKKISRNLSSIHSENVQMVYKYQILQGTGQEKVQISG